jgi:hypothetical protein
MPKTRRQLAALARNRAARHQAVLDRIEEQGKRCPCCDRWLPFGQFHRSKDKPDGHVSYCKLCFRIRYQLTSRKLARHLLREKAAEAVAAENAAIERARFAALPAAARRAEMARNGLG